MDTLQKKRFVVFTLKLDLKMQRNAISETLIQTFSGGEPPPRTPPTYVITLRVPNFFSRWMWDPRSAATDAMTMGNSCEMQCSVGVF